MQDEQLPIGVNRQNHFLKRKIGIQNDHLTIIHP